MLIVRNDEELGLNNWEFYLLKMMKFLEIRLDRILGVSVETEAPCIIALVHPQDYLDEPLHIYGGRGVGYSQCLFLFRRLA